MKNELLAFGGAILLSVFAADAVALQQSNSRSIQVTGEAEQSIEPDHASIRFVLRSFDKKIQDSMDDNNTRARELLADLRKFGIADDDLETGRLISTPRVESSSLNIFKQTGFDVRKDFSVVLRDLEKLDQLFVLLANHEIGIIEQVQFRSIRFDEIERSVGHAAIKDAKRRASDLAAALGQSVGAPTLINHDASSPSYLDIPTGGYISISQSPDESSHSPGKIVVRANVRVFFELLDNDGNS